MPSDLQYMFQNAKLVHNVYTFFRRTKGKDDID